EPLVELEPRGPPAVPEHRPRALAPHPAQPARAALPGGPRAARGLRQRQRLPPSLRRGPDPDAPRDLERRYLVPQGAPRAGRPARRLLLRRIRAAQLGADLFWRPRRARRRPVQGVERPRRAHGGRRTLLHEGILRPAPPPGRVAGGQRRGVRRPPPP